MRTVPGGDPGDWGLHLLAMALEISFLVPILEKLGSAVPRNFSDCGRGMGGMAGKTVQALFFRQFLIGSLLYLLLLMGRRLPPPCSHSRDSVRILGGRGPASARQALCYCDVQTTKMLKTAVFSGKPTILGFIYFFHCCVHYYFMA